MKASVSSAAFRISIVIAAAGAGLALSAVLVAAHVTARSFLALLERRQRKGSEG